METVRDVVLRVTTIKSFKWQCLLHSGEITTARGLSSVHQTDAEVAEQASASLRRSPQAATPALWKPTSPGNKILLPHLSNCCFSPATRN